MAVQKAEKRWKDLAEAIARAENECDRLDVVRELAKLAKVMDVLGAAEAVDKVGDKFEKEIDAQGRPADEYF